MFEQLLERMAKELDALGLPYMVIGGQAVMLYGEPRLTRDIDVTLGVGPDQWHLVAELARRLRWTILPREPAELVKKTLVLPCLDPSSGVRLDFIFSFSEYERQAIRRVRRIPIGSASVSFASLEDLVIHKIVAGRPRDLEDTRLVLLKNPNLDSAYVERWLQEFNRSLGEPFLERFRELRDQRPG